MTKVKEVVKKTGSALGKFGAGVAGYGLGAFAIRKFPKTNIAFGNGIVDKVLPGLAGIVTAVGIGMYFNSKEKLTDQLAQGAAFGLGIVGFADIFTKTLGPKLPAWVTDNTPKLNGAPGYAAVNQGDFPPSYYKENAFQGAPMQGAPMQGLKGLGDAYYLSGGSPYALNGNAFALSGNPYALN